MKTMIRRNIWVVMISLALITMGCKGAGFGGRSDAQVASEVQNKIFSDNSIPDKQITISSNKGVVTLTGSVSSDAVRTAAANDAAQIDGVKTVVNNLEVASAANTPAPTMDNTPQAPEPAAAPAPRRATTTNTRKSSPSRRYSENRGDNGLRTTVPASDNSGSGSSYQSQNTAPSAPAAPPVPQKVTVPAGTQLSVRINEELNSEKAQIGDVFHGSISAPVTIDDQTVIPTPADVEGRVVEVKSAGRFAGQSVLTLQLTRLSMNGRSYSIQTDQWSKSGNGRGKSTAAKVGGGAAAGEI